MANQRGLIQVTRETMRTRHRDYRTEQSDLQRIRRYIVYQNQRHPRDLGAAVGSSFLTHMAMQRKVRATP